MIKEPDSSDWMVKYRRLVRGSFEVEEETIRAAHVILGAGVFGSTKLLLRSKERGLNVSEQTGKRFSTNGDVLAASYNGARKANAMGLETKNKTRRRRGKPPGPCIASIMDFRRTGDGNIKHHFVIEDGTPPSVAAELFSVGLIVSAKIIGVDEYPSDEILEAAWRVNRNSKLKIK